MMTNERADELFREYRRTHDIAIRNQLVENYMYVAEIIAKKFVGRGVDYDDLLQAAAYKQCGHPYGMGTARTGSRQSHIDGQRNSIEGEIIRKILLIL